MTTALRKRLVLVNCALALILMGGVVVLTGLSWSGGSVDSRIGSNLWPLLIISLLALVGTLIATRRPENSLGTFMCLIASTGALLGLTESYVEYDLYVEAQSEFAVGLAAWLFSWLWVWVLMPPITVLFLLCPDGRLPSQRWRPVLLLDITALLILTITQAFHAGPFEDFPTIDNPFGIPAFDPIFEVANLLGFLLLIPAIGMSGSALVHRFRKSHGRERLQLKWFAMAAVIAILVFLASWPISIFGPDVWGYTTILTFCLLPVAAGIAILRHQLYDIDRIINRTLVYGLLTAALAFTYAGLVVGLQALLRPFSGGSDLAIVVTTLVVAALFLPARRRVQDVVDRRFNRRAYDAARTIDAFSARLREQIDLDTLRYELLAVVDETMQPASASLWLRNRL